MNQQAPVPSVAFGDFVREARLRSNIIGRDAARNAGLLPSNFSKLEHGILPPSKDGERQRALASAIGIQPGTAEETKFFELAAMATDSVPIDLAEIISKNDTVPLLLRTVGNKRLTDAEIAKIVEIVHAK